jgi:hypothetical protein
MPFASDRFVRREDGNEREFLAYERLLGRWIRPFIAELYMVNAGIMASYICTQQNANIGDIVASSTEALMRPEALRYGQSATLALDWGEAPAITIRMEFLHDSLTAFFDLVFEQSTVGVRILGILYKEAVVSAEDNFARFSQAVGTPRVLNS